MARILWRSSPWPISFLAYSTMSISVWVVDILSPVAAFCIPKSEVRKFHLFVTLMLDLIWRCRNILIHEGVQPSPIRASHQLSYSFKFHLKAWNDLVLPVLWLPPTAGWVKGNFDIAAKDSYSVVVAVISDENGDIVGAVTQKLQCTNALQGEALVALLTAHLAASLGYKLLAWEGDVLLGC